MLHLCSICFEVCINAGVLILFYGMMYRNFCVCRFSSTDMENMVSKFHHTKMSVFRIVESLCCSYIVPHLASF